MKKILITNTYFLQFDPKQRKIMHPYAPLATLYAASVLRNAGNEIQLVDNVFSKAASDIFPAIENFVGEIFFICDDGFNYLTKMCLVNMRQACFEMIRFAKSKNCTVVVSSSDATDHWKDYLGEGADFIIAGEMEQTIVELTNAINAGKESFDFIPGLKYKSGFEYLATGKREVIHDLDSIPFPAWDLIDLNKYHEAWKHSGYFSINMTTTRGCPFKCNWCAKPIYGNRYNSRSPENVVAEIKMLIDNYDIEHIWFCDDIFGLKPGWIKTFSELIITEKIRIKFKIQCRADLLLDENNIEHLSSAGCDEIWIGAESGSQKILDAMDKGTTVEQIYRSTELMKKHGIKPCFFLQFGYLGEQKEDIDATIKMLNDLMPHDIGISVSYPLPGTKFYEIVKNDLVVKQNWNDSDELLLMFRSTYSPGFYRQLHRYVHKNYRIQQGMRSIQKIFSKPAAITKTELRRIATLPLFATMNIYNRIRLNSLMKS